MTATFTIHIEMAESDVVWWAETPDIAGLSVAAPTLMGLRQLITESVTLHLGADVDVVLNLAANEDDSGTAVADTAEDNAPAAHVTRGPRVHTAFVPLQVAA